MAIIGKFRAKNDGFEGVLATLTLNATLRFSPISNASNDANGPAYRIMAGSSEVGAAWRKLTRLDQREYFYCKIDDPVLQEPIYGSLVAAGDSDSRDYLLVWTRRAK